MKKRSSSSQPGHQGQHRVVGQQSWLLGWEKDRKTIGFQAAVAGQANRYLTHFQSLSDTLSDRGRYSQVIASTCFVCNSNRKGHLERASKWPSDGGGGDRTRVPRHFHADFYVRSRTYLHTVVAQPPIRQGRCLTSRPRFLIPGVANVDPRRSGITAGSRFSPAKNLSRGCLVRQPEPCY